MASPPGFLFVTCQVEAEGAVKRELERRWPDFRFAYSRPGFLTFKLPPEHGLVADFNLESVLVRSYGFCLGRANGADNEARAARVWELYGSRPVRRVHVWQRDTVRPGESRFDPGVTQMAQEAEVLIRAACPCSENLTDQADTTLQRAKRGDFVLDCILVEPEEWWVGYHRVKSGTSRWPGGVTPLVLPEEAVSRAWLKMAEALAWSGFPIGEGSQCVEIGSAPGGSSQALLATGAIVTGIDPAEMASSVLEHPNFTHLRRRARDVRHREFRKVEWLTSDMIVAPKYTLDVVETIATQPDVRLRGMLLTLKLPDWAEVENLPEHLERIRSWGFETVRARQLVHNRYEVCVAAS